MKKSKRQDSNKQNTTRATTIAKVAGSIMIGTLSILVMLMGLLSGKSKNIQLGSNFLGNVLGLDFLNWMDDWNVFLQWAATLGMLLGAMLILFLLFYLPIKASKAKQRNQDEQYFNIQQQHSQMGYQNTMMGYGGNSQMFLGSGQGGYGATQQGYGGGNHLSGGYMPPEDGQMMLGQPMRTSQRNAGSRGVSAAQMSLVDILGFDPNSPLLQNDRSEGRVRAQKELKVIEQRLKKATDEHRKLSATMDATLRKLDMERQQLDNAVAELQDLIAQSSFAPKKDAVFLSEEIAVKEDMCQGLEVSFNTLNNEVDGIGQNLDRLAAYIDDLTRLKADTERANKNSGDVNNITDILKSVNTLIVQIQRIEEQVADRNAQKEILTAELKAAQLKLLTATDPIIVSQLSQTVEQNNIKLAEIETNNAEALRERLDKKREYDRAYKEANIFVDGLGISYEELVNIEDNILAEIHYNVIKTENELAKSRIEKSYEEAQRVYKEKQVQLDVTLADVSMQSAKQVADIEAELSAMNAELFELQSKIDVAPTSEKLTLFNDKTVLEKRLRETNLKLESAKSSGLKSRLDIKNKYDKELALAKNTVERLKKELTQIETQIKSSMTLEQTRAMIGSGTGVLSLERKAIADKQAKIVAIQEEFAQKRLDAQRDGEVSMSFFAVIKQEIAKAQNGDEAARIRMETDLLSRMTNDEQDSYRQMNANDKWRYAIMDAEERMRRLSYETKDRIAALDAEEKMRLLQIQAEEQVANANKTVAETEQKAQEEIEKNKQEIEELKKKLEELESNNSSSVDPEYFIAERNKYEEQLRQAQAQQESIIVESKLEVEKANEAVLVAAREVEEIRDELEKLRAETEALISGDTAEVRRQAEEEIARMREAADIELARMREELEETKQRAEFAVEQARQEAELATERARQMYEVAGSSGVDDSEARFQAHQEITRIKEELEELKRQKAELEEAKENAESASDRAKREAEEMADELRRQADLEMEHLRAELASAQETGRLSQEEEEALLLMRQEQEQQIMAQAEADRLSRLEELTREQEARQAAEREVENARQQLETLKAQLEEESERARIESERNRELAEIARQEAEKARKEATKASEEAERLKVQAEQEVESAKAQIEAFRAQLDEEIERAKGEADIEIERAKAEIERAKADAERAKQQAEEEVANTIQQVEMIRSQLEEEKEGIRQQLEQEKLGIQSGAEQDIEKAKADAELAIERAKETAAAEVERTRLELERERQLLEERAAEVKAELEREKQQLEEQANRAKSEAELEVERARRELEELRRQAETETERIQREAEESANEARRLADMEVEKLRAELIAANEGMALSAAEEEALRVHREEEEKRIIAEAEAVKQAKQAELEQAEEARRLAEAELERTKAELVKLDEDAQRTRQELLDRMRAEDERVEANRISEKEKLEQENRIAQKVALKRIDVLRIKEQIPDIKVAADAKVIIDKLQILSDNLDVEERQSTVLQDIISRTVLEATHAGEIATLRAKLSTVEQVAPTTTIVSPPVAPVVAEPPRERRIMKKVIERVNRIAPQRRTVARMGARPVSRAGARPTARPVGARPMARSSMGARPATRPIGARPAMGARPTARPVVGTRPTARPSVGGRPPMRPR